MKFTEENNPSHFLDTAIEKEDSGITTSVYTKPKKLPMFWTSRIPNKYKKNAIRTDLHRAKEISSNLDAELIRIRKKYAEAGFPKRFVESVIREQNETKEDVIIPPWLFDDRKTVIISIPYCETNEKQSKTFVDKLTIFTKNKFLFRIVWKTRKIRTLFPLKDKILHPACVIYKGVCSCGATYVGQTGKNAYKPWQEHTPMSTQKSEKSEPAKHLETRPTHKFEWKVLSAASKFLSKRKILEDFFITKTAPSLNEQLTSKVLRLFRHGVT